MYIHVVFSRTTSESVNTESNTTHFQILTLNIIYLNIIYFFFSRKDLRLQVFVVVNLLNEVTIVSL